MTLLGGWRARQPYDVIVFTGSMEVLPEEVFSPTEGRGSRVRGGWQAPGHGGPTGQCECQRYVNRAPLFETVVALWPTRPGRRPLFSRANTERWLSRLMPRHLPPSWRADARSRDAVLLGCSRAIGISGPPVSKNSINVHQCPRWLRGSTKCGSWPGMTSPGRDRHHGGRSMQCAHSRRLTGYPVDRSIWPAVH